MANNNALRGAFRHKSCWAALSAALLAACGGGGAGDGTTASGANTDQVATAAASETDVTLANKSWSSSSSGWTYCADEWGTCSFSGTRQVRYGANGSYAYKTATGSIACTNDVFGDPAYGAAKTCSYSNSTTSTTSTSTTSSTTTTAPATSTTTPTGTTSTTTTSPTSTTTTTTSPTTSSTASWTYCADEWGTCSFSGTRQVRYGANGSYAYKTATGSISCTNDVFGDPAYGAAKTCSYSSTTTTSSTTGATTPTGTTISTGTTTTTPTTSTSTPSTSTATPGPYMQDASLYALAFQDEFNGTSLDTTKWNDHIWYDPPSSTKDYGVANGTLKIWPQADANGQFKERILTTAGKFEQAYGYFEMEAKLPIGSGCWPAFWLLNSDSPPGEPEIDIMEAYSGDKTGYWADSSQHPIRYGATFYQNGNGQSGLQGTQAPYTGDLSTGFHKYGLKWEPSKLSFYFDGKLVYTANVTMSRKMYILLDMQYGSASGSVDGTTPLGQGNSFEVNYVRAWTLK